MKKIIFLTLFVLLHSHKSTAQVVDKSINSIQIGFLGIWLNNESKIAPNWALRSEIGFESPFSTGFGNGGFEACVFAPVASLETRWYYNSPKRQGNSKNTFHNSSNHASLIVRYHPEFLVFDYCWDDNVDGGIFLIPSWGIRRNLSYRFNYELGIGAGIDVYELLTDESGTTDFIMNIHIRIGYKFGKSFKSN